MMELAMVTTGATMELYVDRSKSCASGFSQIITTSLPINDT